MTQNAGSLQPNKDSSKYPQVSVVMPVYNGQTFLPQAVESILKQRFGDFEFIILDDGSTDDTWAILRAYAARDSRIVLLRNHQNLGLIKTLNKGISLARGNYIARMDADDISHIERLATQVTYLEDHPTVGVLGTAYIRLYADGATSLRQPPVTDTAIRWHLLFGNIWCHPSIMFRRRLVALEQPFYRDFLHAEDYELWPRLLKHTRAATLTTPLVSYRMHSNSICATNPEPQEQMVTRISVNQIRELVLGQLTTTAIEALRRCHFPQQAAPTDIVYCSSMLQLFKTFAQQPGIDQVVVQQLRRQWIRRVLASSKKEHLFKLTRINLLAKLVYQDPVSLFLTGYSHLSKQIFSKIYASKSSHV